MLRSTATSEVSAKPKGGIDKLYALFRIGERGSSALVYGGQDGKFGGTYKKQA